MLAFGERTTDSSQDHVDERAHKFFSGMYGGIKGGYHFGWNSTKEGLRPTTTVFMTHTHFCAYCGRQALPIQEEKYSHRTGQDEYCSVGHTCVCKDAMDELEMMDQIKSIREKLGKAIRDCQNAMPRANQGVISAMIDLKAKEMKKDFEFYSRGGSGVPVHSIESLGFKIAGPRVEDDEEEHDL